MTAFTQRVESGAYYTDGRDLWEVVEVHPLGTVTLNRASGTRSGSGGAVGRCMGIDAFRRTMWLVRAA